MSGRRNQTRTPGKYAPLVWDLDEPAAHYVNGHVSDDQFRDAIEAYFGDSKRKPVVPLDAKIEHVYVRVVRAPAHSDLDTEWRHTARGRGAFPMTYWEIEPHRGVTGGAW